MYGGVAHRWEGKLRGMHCIPPAKIIKILLEKLEKPARMMYMTLEHLKKGVGPGEKDCYLPEAQGLREAGFWVETVNESPGQGQDRVAFSGLVRL